MNAAFALGFVKQATEMFDEYFDEVKYYAKSKPPSLKGSLLGGGLIGGALGGGFAGILSGTISPKQKLTAAAVGALLGGGAGMGFGALNREYDKRDIAMSQEIMASKNPKQKALEAYVKALEEIL